MILGTVGEEAYKEDEGGRTLIGKISLTGAMDNGGPLFQ